MLNVLSVALGAIFYVLGATFCGHQPLYKILYRKCYRYKEKYSEAPYQAGINYYVVVY